MASPLYVPTCAQKDFCICTQAKTMFPKGVIGTSRRKQGVVTYNCPLPLQVGFKIFPGQLLRHLTHTRSGPDPDQRMGRGLHLTSPVGSPSPAAWEPGHCPGVQWWPTPDCICLLAWHRLYHVQAQTNILALSSSLKNRTKHKSLISTNTLQICRTSSI